MWNAIFPYCNWKTQAITEHECWIIFSSFTPPDFRFWLSTTQQTLFWGPYYAPGTVLHADKINKTLGLTELILWWEWRNGVGAVGSKDKEHLCSGGGGRSSLMKRWGVRRKPWEEGGKQLRENTQVNGKSLGWTQGDRGWNSRVTVGFWLGDFIISFYNFDYPLINTDIYYLLPINLLPQPYGEEHALGNRKIKVWVLAYQLFPGWYHLSLSFPVFKSGPSYWVFITTVNHLR